MKVFTSIKELHKYYAEFDIKQNKTIGFVPTMGALHEGHISLINQSKTQTDITICSIFVNPTQFNDKNDFLKYPIQIDQDLELLIQNNCDVCFLPSVEEIYPNGTNENEKIDLGYIATVLEGKHRPGHFDGVVQVVKRLLDIVQPTTLFLGQKDFQQCMIITKMVAHYNLPIAIKIAETLRENDGLAMSSRNVRLSSEQRIIATQLYQTLCFIKDNKTNTDLQELIENEITKLNALPEVVVEYLKIRNAQTLEPFDRNKNTENVVLVAAKVGNVRLIDNLLLG